MDETKLNILICGLTSDSSLLFIPLYNFLKSSKHKVEFFVPEYSGAVCLMEQNIPIIELKNIDLDTPLDTLDSELLKLCLDYDLIQNEFRSGLIKRIKQNQIANEGKNLFRASKKYLHKNEIDLIIVWGGIRSYSRIPAIIAKNYNIKCIFIEKGLYPFTLQVDSQGVNGFSKLKEEFAIPNDSKEINPIHFYRSLLNEKWYSAQPLDTIKIKTKVKYFFKHLAFNELFVKLYHKYFETLLFNKFIYKKNWELTDPVRPSMNFKESGYIFVPFQVSDDSQLLVQDNWIKDNIALVKSVLKSLNDLGIKRKIIVKEHPREFRKINYKEILQEYDVYFSEVGTTDLILGSSLVVTINSTVGFEALVFCKPVIITGSALYEFIPFITKVDNQSDLTSSIKKILSSNNIIDESKIVGFASGVYQKLVKCNYVSPTERELNNLWQKILEINQSFN